MEIMDYLIKLIELCIWPTVVLIVFFVLKKPLKALLPFVNKLKYKDLEVSFSESLKEVREETEQSGIKVESTQEEKLELYQLIEISPSSAIIESWKDIEVAAREKIKLLVDDDSMQKALRRPLTYLELTGALIPSTARAIRELQSLRNQAAHSNHLQISKEDVLEYVNLAKAITNQINAITELPKQKLKVLTLLILEYNHLIDTGKYSISIDEIHQQIESRNVIGFLSERTSEDSDFSMFGSEGPYVEYVKYYNEQLLQIFLAYAGNENRKWGVEQNGLCLLVAWTNELIQQGAGWHPNH